MVVVVVVDVVDVVNGVVFAETPPGATVVDVVDPDGLWPLCTGAIVVVVVGTVETEICCDADADKYWSLPA